MSKKIYAMHETYGENKGLSCKGCCNLISGMYHDRYYSKCIAYGVSHSESTDWRKSYVACGLYNKPFDDKEQNPLIDIFRSRREPKHIKPLAGQLSLINS